MHGSSLSFAVKKVLGMAGGGANKTKRLDDSTIN